MMSLSSSCSLTNIAAVHPCRNRRTQSTSWSLERKVEQFWYLKIARSMPAVNLLIAVTVFGTATDFQSIKAALAVDGFHPSFQKSC